VIMQGNVELKESHGISGKWISANNYCVSLKKSVGLVARQEKLEKGRM